MLKPSARTPFKEEANICEAEHGRYPHLRTGIRVSRFGAFPVRWAPWALALLALGGCARVSVPVPQPEPTPGWTEVGVASWYGEPFHGRTTASGETYNMEAMTAAHRTLPFGTLVLVENLNNGRHTTLRINDRGPFVRGRILDVSRGGARELEMITSGIARVRVTIVESPPTLNCWEVQVGTFRDPDNAAELQTRLADEGRPVDIQPASGGLHQVRVGPLHSRAEADRLASRWDGLVLNCPS